MQYRTSEENIWKTLSLLAQNKEYAQKELPKALGKDYHTGLRYIQKLEKEGDIELARTESPDAGGKAKKFYRITVKGFIKYVFLSPKPCLKLEEVVQNHPDMFLTFTKFGQFKKAGVAQQILEVIGKAVDSNRLSYRMVFQKAEIQPHHVELIKQQIDKAILVDYILLAKDKNLAKVCKADPKLDHFITTEINKDIREAKTILERTTGYLDWYASLS